MDSDLHRYQAQELQAIIITEDDSDHMHPLTEERPKALLPIANQPMIYFALTYLENAGFKGRIMCLRYNHFRGVCCFNKEKCSQDWKISKR
jgi:dTDP-glucose pyrophosphorylase